MEHFQKIGFDFNKFVDISFKSFVCHFVPLPVAIDILMCFLTEGVKIVYRYTYAILKYHKDFIKTSCLNPDDLMPKLRERCRTNTDPVAIKKIAFKYRLKSHHTSFQKAAIDVYKQNDPDASLKLMNVFQLPTGCKTSTILSYEEFSHVWGMLPEYVRIRNPELLYNTHTDGFNI